MGCRKTEDLNAETNDMTTAIKNQSETPTLSRVEPSNLARVSPKGF